MTGFFKRLFGKEDPAARAERQARLLAPHRDKIKEAELPYIAIDVRAEAPADAAGSQIGGLAWWPASRAYPAKANGRPLYLLAQINFAEMPPLDPFPRTGLLQLFISDEDDFGMGTSSADGSSGFCCVYHPDLTGDVLSDFTFLTAQRVTDYFALVKPLQARALTLRADRMPPDTFDYRFAQLLPDLDADEAACEAYIDSQRATPLRMGGYSSFTQSDPREDPDWKDGTFLLFMAGTTDGLMWGDAGIANFFIDEDDLRRRDFSRVSFYWDCC